MMSGLFIILNTVDSFLSLKVVRWVMFSLIVVLIATVLIVKARLTICTLQKNALEGSVAKLNANLEVQNEAIKKANQRYIELEARTFRVKGEVVALEKQLDKRNQEVRDLVLVGSCEDMVQQVIDEVRK